ncbi:MAG TPA: pyridoxal-dependent decarboxylase [Gemmatimonadaceae bacterium]|nr:pyridoxal-dependent decarboxylase [Gemmatimonadaceae bacterium]
MPSRRQPPATLDLDVETMRRIARAVTDLVVDHIATLREQPARRSLSPTDAERLLHGPPPEHGSHIDELLGVLAERVLPWHAREPSPRFMGYIPSSPTFPAIAGDWLATGFNFFAGVWTVASGPNQLELTVLDWFRQWLGMPEGTSGLMTTGGSAATLTAVVASRHRVDPDGDEIARLTVYTSDQAHSSVARAAWIAGIPRANVRSIATDGAYRVQVDALREAVAADRAAGLVPFLVVASAGTTNTGAIDPLGAIAELCEGERLWMHVDAAYAGFAALLPSGSRLLTGIERADSVTLDPHKWLFVPFECGSLLVRDQRALAAAFSVHPEYLGDVQGRAEEVNFADLGIQLSRSAKALKIWLSVGYYGIAGIREAIERGIRRAEYAETLLRSREDVEILSPAQLGVVCFRLHPPGMDHPGALDALNEAINARVNAGGRFLMSSTRLHGRFSLRLCTHVHRMTEVDIDEVVQAITTANFPVD